MEYSSNFRSLSLALGAALVWIGGAVATAEEPSPEPGPSTSTEVTPSPDATPSPTSEPTDSVEPEESPSPEPTATSEAPCTITIEVDPERPVGVDSQVRGATHGCDAGRLELQVQGASGWETRSSIDNNGDESYVADLEGMDQPGTYLVRAVMDESASPEVVQVRSADEPTMAVARHKVVNELGYAWGTFVTSTPITVWTEVYVSGRGWLRSRTGTTQTSGFYKIPITYGSDIPGVHRYRVAGRYPDGTVRRTAEMSQQRFAKPTISSAGTKRVGFTTYAWGSFDVNRPIAVHSEVYITGKGWLRSQVSQTTATGYYQIPLSYGANTPGTYRYRVVGRYPGGYVVRTATITLKRIAASANPVITRTTSAEVAGHYHAGCPAGPSRMSTIRVNYYNYSGQVQRGEIIVRRDLASQVAAIFTDAFNAKFPIFQMRNPNVWDGSDPAMMAANNTSGFNCRKVVGNPYAWSPHAYGIAVDVNPVQNPYRDPTGKWWPNSKYATYRPAGVKGMHYDNGAMVRAMSRRGWEWGRGWDWHHFQKKN